jgi:protein TonB
MKSLTRLLLPILLCAVPLAVVRAETKTEPPVPVRTVAPEYPSEMRREGINGVVMVKCTIDEQGNVLDPQVEKSSNAAFEKPAVDALLRWKFKPAKQDGAPVAIKVSIPIKFVADA